MTKLLKWLVSLLSSEQRSDLPLLTFAKAAPVIPRKMKEIIRRMRILILDADLQPAEREYVSLKKNLIKKKSRLRMTLQKSPTNQRKNNDADRKSAGNQYPALFLIIFSTLLLKDLQHL